MTEAGPGPWHKATASTGNGGGCVEVRDLPDGGRQVRDTKDGDTGPILTYTASEWAAFLSGVRAGEFD